MDEKENVGDEAIADLLLQLLKRRAEQAQAEYELVKSAALKNRGKSNE